MAKTKEGADYIEKASQALLAASENMTAGMTDLAAENLHTATERFRIAQGFLGDARFLIDLADHCETNPGGPISKP